MASNINNYKINFIKELGRGHFGVVGLYEVLNTNLHVAVKTIEKNGDETHTRNIQRELEALTKLKNGPNILNLVHVIETPHNINVVTDFYPDTQELFDFVEGHYSKHQKPLSDEDIANIFEQITDAVKYCHDNHTAHRDIKLENFLINPFTKKITLIDFGLSREIPMDKQGRSSPVFTSCGTPEYTAPEIFTGTAYDPIKSDIWSMGAVLFTLATGSMPFLDDNTANLIAAISLGKYTIPDDIDRDLKDLIQSMLQVNTDKRIGWDGILNHPFVQKHKPGATSESVPIPMIAPNNPTITRSSTL